MPENYDFLHDFGLSRLVSHENARRDKRDKRDETKRDEPKRDNTSDNLALRIKRYRVYGLLLRAVFTEFCFDSIRTYILICS